MFENFKKKASWNIKLFAAVMTGAASITALIYLNNMSTVLAGHH